MKHESPFAKINGIISEPSSALDDLRIIASNGGRLDGPTRAIISDAADELEATQKLLLSTQASLIEAHARLIATNDRLIELLKKNAPAIRPLSVTLFNWPIAHNWMPSPKG